MTPSSPISRVSEGTLVEVWDWEDNRAIRSGKLLGLVSHLYMGRSTTHVVYVGFEGRVYEAAIDNCKIVEVKNG